MQQDHFVQAVKTGPSGKSQLMNHPLVAIVLLAAAFGLLVWNEGKTDYSQIAATSTEISSDTESADAGLQGKLVSVSGLLTTADLISDGQYLKPASYIALERTVEMFAWIEKKNTTGEGANQIVTYDYEKIWLRGPADATTFANPLGHENPVMAVREFKTKASSAKIGAFSVDMASVTLPSFSPLKLTADKVLPYPGVHVAGDDFLFVGRGTNYAPQVGDLRIKYSVLESNVPVTVFGALRGTSIATFTDAENHSLQQIVRGNRSQALAALKSQQAMTTWVARVFGLLLMWGALVAFMKPTGLIGRSVGSVASMSASSVRVVSLIIALALSAAAIFVGISMA